VTIPSPGHPFRPRTPTRTSPGRRDARTGGPHEGGRGSVNGLGLVGEERAIHLGWLSTRNIHVPGADRQFVSPRIVLTDQTLHLSERVLDRELLR
jgi:hypothetical protein